MKNKRSYIIILLFLIIIFLVVLGRALLFGRGNPQETLTINGNKINVEVVSDQQKLELGLGGRDSLESNSGMLFVFPTSASHSFWMKCMKFDLDIIWINDHRIVHIEKNVKADFAGVLTPSEPSDHVLEIAAGAADRMDAKEGDEILGY